ncbi:MULTISPECIES: hypothetical protein [Leptolyngbya]|uniref:hypothetical protein n=1 Tax=Leptolyngbya TaxID=47251 RepID=UPI001684AF01|nr:hypothetical protein [Leptolyngbya sp. FACHB-1624]MBD1856576.1 hypothetical protein [Leptolyngbya sp. FACHB-1624]
MAQTKKPRPVAQARLFREFITKKRIQAFPEKETTMPAGYRRFFVDVGLHPSETEIASDKPIL